MARKAAHDQRSLPTDFVCHKCRDDVCNQCIDIMRIAVGLTTLLCYCKRKKHSGEPNDNQIVDPENGTVYGPGLRVTQDGEVIRND